MVLSRKGAEEAEDAVRMAHCYWDNRACYWNSEWSEGEIQAAASLRRQKVCGKCWWGKVDELCVFPETAVRARA